jgi:flagellar biosynthetic protein FliP
MRATGMNGRGGWGRGWVVATLAVLCFTLGDGAAAQDAGRPPERPPERPADLPRNAAVTPPVMVQSGSGGSLGGFSQIPDLSNRQNLSSALQLIILLTVLSLAPAILIMMTSFTRIVIVMSLLRQALGAQQLPPNQILIGLSLFMTFLVMRPTWERVNTQAVQPYLNGTMEQREALDRAQQPLREFMFKQIDRSGNWEDVYMFAEAAGQKGPTAPKTKGDVGTLTLIPAFVLSELKTAFLLGFKIYLPFLIIDMVISAVLISMGMMMLPPVLISLPFKLLLFVLVDGWHLITGSLMGSFAT